MAGKICDVCDRKHPKTMVVCSGLGPVSFAYCPICGSLGAEPDFLMRQLKEDGIPISDSIVYYNGKDDKYYYFNSGQHYVIQTTNGKKFDTRQECLDYFENN